MPFNPDQYNSSYLHLHADCISVKGATRSAIYDLTRNELIFFPTAYYDILEFLTSDTIGNLFESIECEDDLQSVTDFIEFLQQAELIDFLTDTSLFPALEERWDVPAIIQNAIIDVDRLHHDFDRIFYDLDQLGCLHVQIRSFSGLLTLEHLQNIVSSSLHKSITGIELIIPYDSTVNDESYIRFVEDHPILSGFILHSAPEERTIAVTYGCDEETGRYITKQIRLVSQVIDSHLHCGVFSISHLNAPSVNNFFETKLHNGCLNRKVSIDANGDIKNCPSLTTAYGNIYDTTLEEAINKAGFRDKWNITKDQIDICRDCEFRYACSDCRAFTENPQDAYSKPLKCGYNPYTCEWEEWSSHPLKQKAIREYGMMTMISKEQQVQTKTERKLSTSR